MNKNAELLNYIYQNTAMGVNTINQIKEKVKDDRFFKELQYQLDEYQKIHDEAKQILISNGKSEKDLSAMDKIKTYIMVNMNLIADKSVQHISEMLIQGSTMGIIDCTKHINDYDNADPQILTILNKLLHFEQQNIERLKKFL